MANKFFNIRYPKFINDYGLNWTSLKSEIDSFVDLIISKIFTIYNEININTMQNRIVEIQMKLKGIKIDSLDTLQDKKIKLRSFVAREKEKSLDTIYLDVAEEIVGTRGIVYGELEIGGGWILDESEWADTSTSAINEITWSSPLGYQFRIYIDVKTLDNDELDHIVRLFLESTLRPAYYLIFLIDSNFNILRTVT